MIKTVDIGVRKYAAGTAMALLTCAVLALPAQARSVSSTVVVPPAELPAAAREPAEAIFLHDAGDGRTLLYIQHEGDSGMAVLDVTDPAHIKAQGSVPLAAARGRESRRELANDATGTTFLLTDGGLYVVRQPSVELIRKLREQNYAN